MLKLMFGVAAVEMGINAKYCYKLSNVSAINHNS